MKSAYFLKIMSAIIIIIVAVSAIAQNDAFGPVGSIATPIPFLFTPFYQINYSKDDLIQLSDQEWSNLDGKQAIMKVFNPDGKMYLSRPVTLGFEPTRGANFTISGPLAIPGYYEISLYYNNQLHVGTAILYDGKDADPDRYYTYMAWSGNTDIPIRYKVGANTVLDYITLNHTSNTVYFHVQLYGPTKSGMITIELPRNVIDSKSYDDTDQPFVVSTAGLDVDEAFLPYDSFTEVSNNNNTRTLVITIPSDSPYFNIAIQGTQSVPEFGQFAMPIFAISIISLLAVFALSNRFKNFHT